MKKQLLLLFATILFSLNHYSQNLSITQEADCVSGCSDLTIDFNNDLGTSNYTVESIPANPPFSFYSNGSATNFVADDLWSSIIDLEFNFSFFQNTYSQVLISTNGAISFDLNNENNFHYWTPGDGQTIPNNADAALKDGNIFGAIHDTDPSASENFEVSYEVIGEAPFRAFVVRFANLSHFNCTDLKTSQMIILYETTNVIETFIYQKPICATWAGGRAALGIQNNAGTQGLSPPQRNTGIWEVTTPEFWRFTPAGTTGFENTYAWYDQTGTVISTDININVCPTADETYTAEVNYYNQSLGAYETVTESITLFADANNSSFFMTATCDGATATITGNTGGVFNFNPIPTDASIIDAATGTVTNATSGATYSVEYTTSGNCSSTSVYTFTVFSQEDAGFIMTSDCSDGATATLFGNPGGTFIFNPVIPDGSSINAATGELTNGVSGTTYAVEYTTSGVCPETATQNITIFDTALEIVTPVNMEVCSPNEFDTDFNLTTQTNVITGGSTCSIVTYYESLVDAENATNVITNPFNYNSYTTNPFTIYVRVENSNAGSYEITMFDLIVNVLPQSLVTVLTNCATNTGFTIFTLSDMDNEVTNGNTDNIVTYYASFGDAENEANPLPDNYENQVANFQAIYARVNSSENTCYSIASCYLDVDNGVELNNISDLVKCGTNGVSSFDLVTYVNQFINGNTTAELTFYQTQDDAENEANSIFPADNYTNTSNPQTVFVRAQDVNSGCISFGSFQLNVEDAATINTPTPLIKCDLDGAEDGFYVFNLSQKNVEILAGLSSNSYNVTYHETQADADAGVNVLNATQYNNTTPNIQTVFARVENLNVGCVSFTTLDLIVEICQVSCEESVTFCYGNNNTTEYTYSNGNGVPMTVLFNAGQVENNWDELIVLDSDGVTNLNTASPYGNNGDLSGLTFTSTGDSITIYVQSDGSASCESSGLDEIDFVVFCNVENGSIEVNAFLDENSDTVFDASEVNFSNGEFTYEVNNDGVTNYVNSSSGSFIIPNTQEGDTYDISFTMFDAFSSCLAQTFTLVEDVVPSQTEVTQVNFPLTSISDCNDIAVYLSANAPPRPGVLYSNVLIIENLGSLPVSGAVEFTHDGSVTLDNVYNVDSGNTVTNTATGFILDFNNLLPGSTEQVDVELNIPTNLNIGDLVTNSVIYNVSDINIDNNESVLTQEVVNSYDPNNKLESHGPEIKLDEFTNEDYLYYTINFQNLGTAEALDIRVEDVLDAQLDVTTFKMLNASHDNVVTRVDNNLVWQFEDINLPSESMDEPNSHGYVYFKIKPLPGYQEGDVIPNTSDIYFDFNPAITTNTFETTFVTSLSVDEFSAIGYNMYPNPASSTVHVKFNIVLADNAIVSIYNIQGKLVNKPSAISNDSEVTFNVSNLSKGMYFVEIKGESFNIVEKLIVE